MRRRIGLTMLVLSVVTLVGSIESAPVRAAPEPGLGQAAAQLLRIDPKSAGLSFGASFGPTSADHRNTVARAVAQSTNLGLLGIALTGAACDGGDPLIAADQLPQPQRADSRDDGSAEVTTITEGPVTQSVVATSAPFARATSRLADLEVPGLITLGGVSNESSSGVDDDGSRIATATARVGELAIAGGLIRLGGMEWTAVHSADAEPVGRFTIGSVTIAGVPMAIHDPAVVFDAVNALIGPLGIELTGAGVHVVDDTVYVDPLTLAVVPNSRRDQVSGLVLGALQPVREELFGALIDADCNSAAYITVLDLLVGSVTGGGSMSVSLAGVSAGTSVADEFQFAPLPPPQPTIAPPQSTTSPTLTPSTRVPARSTPAAPQITTSPAETQTAAPTEAAAPIASTVSDGALAVALVALGLGAGLIEGDRRKMRKAVRQADGSAMEMT